MADTATDDFISGRSYVFLQTDSVTAHMREEAKGSLEGGVVSQDWFVPAGTTFTVLDTHWSPPGSNTTPTTRVSVPNLAVPAENARGQQISDVSLAVNPALPRSGDVAELKL